MSLVVFLSFLLAMIGTDNVKEVSDIIRHFTF